MSTLVEIVLSALLAPVRMLFHSQFVLAALCGWSIQWKSPARADASTPWSEGLRRHGAQSALGLAWVTLVALEAPDFLPWLAPVAAGLILAVPLSVWTSRMPVGLACRKLGLFLTPTESCAPREIVAAEQYSGSGRPLPRFVDAVTDPEVHALVRLAARRRSPLAAAARHERVQLALDEGPTSLTAGEQLQLLGDLDALDALRRAVSSRPVHPTWTSSRADGRATIHHLLPDGRGRPGARTTLVRQG